MKHNKKMKMRLALTSYDSILLDKAVSLIVSTVKGMGSQMRGPVPLPNDRKRYTVLTSPHVDKKAREQYEKILHKRIMDIISPDEKTIEALKQLNISSGVDVQIR